MPQTPAVQDYLKAIYHLRQLTGKVGTTQLARHLSVAPASATDMVKKLAEANLVEHRPYRGIDLTEMGEREALRVIRHHRLIETFLAEVLEVPWDRVHEEAERLEHVISEDLEQRMDRLLGYPSTDPHGAPIPSADLRIRLPENVEPLSRFAESVTSWPCAATVVQVSDHDPALLRTYATLGVRPAVEFDLLDSGGRALTLQVGNATEPVQLARDAADYVLVRPKQHAATRSSTV